MTVELELPSPIYIFFNDSTSTTWYLHALYLMLESPVKVDANAQTSTR
jgi:hypothetical protein